MSEASIHAVELIQRPSVTPEDGTCQDYIENILNPLSFTRHRIDIGGVTNSVFERSGELDFTLGFAGHTDVVPPGEPEHWPHPPFSAHISNDTLHGRGAQDMKGGIACMLAAFEQLLTANQTAPLPTLQLLITSDEEGESIDGTIRIMEYLTAENKLPDAAIVGEPSCAEKVGDTIRRGRRGVVQVHVLLEGVQGHSAYPDQAVNAAHIGIPFFQNILDSRWGISADGFPPTSCQITNIQAGTGAINVVPGVLNATIDIRYNPGTNIDEITHTLMSARNGDDRIHLKIQHQAEAFVTDDGPFLDMVSSAIHQETDIQALRGTGGGTSDARFLAAAGIPVVEIGLTNDTIHQVGERVALHELETLTRVYIRIILNAKEAACL